VAGRIMPMTPDDLREETKRCIDSLLDLVLGDKSQSETPLFSRNDAFQLINAALQGFSVSADSTLAAYAIATMLDTLGLKFWTFDEYEAQVCRRAIRPISLNDDNA
jgi:hypothetical protein